jgi:hypothetical protein
MYKAGAKPSVDGNKKTYYVDAHNRPDVVKYRTDVYCPRMARITEIA